MPIDWSPFVDIVKHHNRFLLTTHVRPDGDGLGSMLALSEVLQQQGKRTKLVVASNLPSRYDFLDPEKRIEHFTLPGDPWRDAEVAVVLDTGTWNQLDTFGPFLRALPAVKVVIDHHLTQDDLGALRLVDVTAEATGRLVYEAIMALGGLPPASAATRLFVALAMDTGWFRHGNTSAATFALAGELVRAGAKADAIYEQLFENNTLPRARLTGLVLERLRTACNGRVAYSEIRLVDYGTTGATPQDTEDLVNYTRGLVGVEVGLFFMEQPMGGVKVSFRSRGRVDVARIAEQFGGGGHKAASGAIIHTMMEDAQVRVLQAISAAIP